MSCDCLTGYQSFCLVEKKSSCFYFNKMETNVILRMHELLQAVDLDGIKAFYDDLQARIDAGKIFPLSENYLPHLELDSEADESFLPIR